MRTDLSGKIKCVEYTISVPLGDEVVNLLGFLSDWGLRNAPVMAVPGRTGVIRGSIKWSTPAKDVAKMCAEGTPKKTSKDFRVIIGVRE